jgi:hypothetical protein
MHFRNFFLAVCQSLLLLSLTLLVGQAWAVQSDETPNFLTLAIVGAVKSVSCTIAASVNDGKPTETIQVAPNAQRANSVSGIAYFSISVRDVGNIGENCLGTNKLSAIKFDSNSQNKSILDPARTGRQAVSSPNLTVVLILFNSDWTESRDISTDGSAAMDFTRVASQMRSAPSAFEEKLNFAIRYTVSTSDGQDVRPGDYFVTLPFVVAMN